MEISVDGSTLLRVSQSDIQNGSFAIPESVTHIGNSAFYGCSGLTQFTIPESVTHIGGAAFSGCSGLTQFTIPQSVTHIGGSAFRGCSGLTQFTIPESVTHIGDFAFFLCHGLTQFTIPESVTHIGDWAFSRCSGLTQFTIPESVTHIGDGAFMGCSGLTQFTIPESVTHIGDSAFRGCHGLTQFTIPESVTHIDDGAFMGCARLRVIVIDATNEADYQRIMALVPQESKNLVIPYTLYQDVKKAKQQALMLTKPIGMDSYPTRFPESLVNIIQQHDERLHNVINQVPLPHQPQELDGYKRALQVALSQFNQEEERIHQRLAAIDKLQKSINMTEEAMEGAKKRTPGFFDSSENKQNLEESQARIAVATKLITWLGGDEAITFTADEKEFLRKPKSAIFLILKNNGINIEELPEAPSPHSSSSSI